MSAELRMLEETVGELFANELAADPAGGTVWRELEEAGLTRAGIAEELGGAGGGLEEAAAIVRLAGYHAVPAPLADTLLVGAWALAEAGLEASPGPVAAAAGSGLRIERDGGGYVVDGAASRVAWARAATSFAVAADGLVARVPAGGIEISTGENLAGEPRDDVGFDRVHVPASSVARGPSPEELRLRGALARSLALAGALERILELSVRYALEREQFGRPIGRFQAVQQELALLAGEVAGARAAVDLAVDDPHPFFVAVAKIRTGDAATQATAIAHQVHGAIGYTRDHELHSFTLRAWAWRDEYGAEEEWAVSLGELVASRGHAELWPTLTGAAA